MFSLLYSLDVGIYHLINQFYHNYLINNLALLVTNLGLVVVALLIVVAIIFIDKKRGKQVALVLVLSLLLTVFATQIIKVLVFRPRPYTVLSDVILLASESDASFPSGHTSTVTAWAYILGKQYGQLKYFMLIPLLVGISRIYIGVHYPSDVLGGFLLGLIISIIVEYIFHNKLKVN